MRAIIVAAAIALAMPAVAEERGEKWDAYTTPKDWQAYGLAWNFPDERSARTAAIRERRRSAKFLCECTRVFSTSVPQEKEAISN